MQHGMGHNLVQDCGHHAAVHYIAPSLELSLEDESAEGFFITVRNLHMEADGVQGTTGKTMLVVRKFFLWFFDGHGSLGVVYAPSDPLDGSLFTQPEDNVANLFVFKACPCLEPCNAHTFGGPLDDT